MAEITGNGSVVKGNVFIFPEDEELTIEDLNGFINYHQQLVKDHYKRNYDIYIGKHEIINRPDNDYGENNKLVVGMPRLLVDEYAGYFGGNPVTIQAQEDSDNDALQDWLKTANFDDEHSEVVKSVAIYGRAYLLEYLDDGKPQLAHVEPDEGFMIYDDTIKASPLAFVRYSYDKERQLHGTLYFADSRSETGYEQQFNSEQLLEPEARVFHGVPAQEFYANEERQGVFDGAVTLINALDNALSRKANQVDYFDNAYLKLLGVQLSPGMDENGNPLPPQIDRQNRLIYSPDVEAPNADIDFVSKPDADNMQENLINRLIDMIYQTTMIPNFRDEAFGGNSSGVALQFKLLPMQNLAAFQERKFQNALRAMFKVVFESADGGQIVPSAKVDAWKDLEITYSRNIPANLADSVQTAVNASSLVSQATAISMIPTIADPQAELEKKQEEQAEMIKQSMQNSDSVPDYLESGEDDGTSSEE